MPRHAFRFDSLLPCRPSEADGLLFALLVLPASIELPNGGLQQAVRRHPSLVKYVDNIRNEFFKASA